MSTGLVCLRSVQSQAVRARVTAPPPPPPPPAPPPPPPPQIPPPPTPVLTIRWKSFLVLVRRVQCPSSGVEDRYIHPDPHTLQRMWAVCMAERMRQLSTRKRTRFHKPPSVTRGSVKQYIGKRVSEGAAKGATTPGLDWRQGAGPEAATHTLWDRHASRNTTQHNTTQHNTTQHNTTQRNTTQRNTTQHNTTQHNTTQHNTTQHNTTQHNTTQLSVLQSNVNVTGAKLLIEHFSITQMTMTKNMVLRLQHLFQALG